MTVANGTATNTSATFSSRAGEDGYVKANADGTSAAVGAFESTYGVAIGRGSDAQINKSVLSFDTSSVPDGASVTGAYVTLSYGSGSGVPWASPAGNRLVLDVQKGCFWGCATEAVDWGSAATAGDTSEVVKFTVGTQRSGGFGSAGLSAVDTVGLTQVRLQTTRRVPRGSFISMKNHYSYVSDLTRKITAATG